MCDIARHNCQNLFKIGWNFVRLGNVLLFYNLMINQDLRSEAEGWMEFHDQHSRDDIDFEAKIFL